MKSHLFNPNYPHSVCNKYSSFAILSIDESILFLEVETAADLLSISKMSPITSSARDVPETTTASSFLTAE
jgi:hypothetical protein